MIPDSRQIGTTDVETWRAVPAEINPSGDELGAWAVVAGDGEDADVYLDITAEYPKRVAEFVTAAVRGEVARQRFDGASGDIAAELERQRQAARPHGPAIPACTPSSQLLTKANSSESNKPSSRDQIRKSYNCLANKVSSQHRRVTGGAASR